ncbi:NUDIX hydrolase [Peteryoungia ipomoeae]|uniref:NUDIX hydrolase n=1 Tax=Peteryoungia ipomoeae TaxID=1210932 RepID=A0A4S8P7X8_9HYPH|nr:NUDIX hydrolase [Peteryoungia ipomoeae]THV24912.1 NUDIX hydrolase [Peteryoungia ipomoeae]
MIANVQTLPELGPDLPDDGSVVELKGYELHVTDGPHPLNLARQAEISHHWTLEKAANPSLFNGPVILQRQIAYRNGVIVSRGHVSDFATFLWWRSQPGLPGASHLFGYPVIASSDGDLIAVRMAPHTANPRQVYFAAGSLDLSDVVNGQCDLDGNMRREVMEETGLDLAEAMTTGQLFGTYRPKKMTLFRVYQFNRSTTALLTAIRDHIRGGHDEIDAAIAIHDAASGTHRYNPAMIPILRWYFERGRSDLP